MVPAVLDLALIGVLVLIISLILGQAMTRLRTRKVTNPLSPQRESSLDVTVQQVARVFVAVAVLHRPGPYLSLGICDHRPCHGESGLDCACTARLEVLNGRGVMGHYCVRMRGAGEGIDSEG